MADQKRVDFQAGGNLLQYMQQVRAEAQRIAKESLTNAQAQSGSLKDQINLIKQQLELEQKKINQRREELLKGDKSEIERLRQQIASSASEGGYGNRRAASRHERRELTEREKTYEQLKKDLEADDKETISLLRQIAGSLSEGQDKQLKSNNELMKEVIEEQQRSRIQQQDQAADQHNKQEQETTPDKEEKGGRSLAGPLFSSLVNLRNLRQIGSDVLQVGRSENGFDAIVPAAQGAGRIVGSILGAIIGTLIEPGGGTIAGAGLGGMIGGELSGGISEQAKRAYDTQQDFIRQLMRYQALTGMDKTNVFVGNRGVGESMGLSMMEMVQMNAEIARRAASTGNALTAEGLTALEKALGVQTQTTLQLIDTERLGIGENKSVQNTITGLLKAGELRGLFQGGDRTFLNEFIGQFSQFSKLLGNVQTKIDDGLVAGLLLNFNRIGGQYQLRDPRALGNITNINQALANPQDDIARAINFRILRRAMPKASLDQLNEEESKGIFSQYLLKGILSEYGNAPQGTVLTSLRNRLGGQLSFDAIRELVQNRDKILYNNADVSQILKKGGMSQEDLFGQASQFTVQADKFKAEITNAYVDGAEEGIKTAISKLSDALEAVFNRAQIKVSVDDSGRVRVDVTQGVALKNKTESPYEPRPFTILEGANDY